MKEKEEKIKGFVWRNFLESCFSFASCRQVNSYRQDFGTKNVTTLFILLPNYYSPQFDHKSLSVYFQQVFAGGTKERRIERVQNKNNKSCGAECFLQVHFKNRGEYCNLLLRMIV